MSQKDVSSIQYFENPEHFADMLNGYIFSGKQLILPEHIQERNRSISMPSKAQKKNKSITVNRDVVREVGMQMNTTIIALEEQSDIHYAMPVRVMSGDAAMYHAQWRTTANMHHKEHDLKGAEFLSGFSKNDTLTPVSTIILYFGQEPWNGPRCLKDMLDMTNMPQEMQDFVADYPLHILEVRRFPDYDFFRTDLKLVFGFLQHDQHDEELHTYIMQNQREFENLSPDTFQLISEFSHSTELINQLNTQTTRKEGVNMCKAIDDMIAKSEKRGFERGVEHGIERGIERSIQSIIHICRDLGASKETILQKIISEISLSEEQAMEYIQKYWA